uniref:Uncharacterized protein n=1 Tax=Arundo donax TaxID=35708 RepID=A0A0A8YL92_ARUDO
MTCTIPMLPINIFLFFFGSVSPIDHRCPFPHPRQACQSSSPSSRCTSACNGL